MSCQVRVTFTGMSSGSVADRSAAARVVPDAGSAVTGLRAVALA